MSVVIKLSDWDAQISSHQSIMLNMDFGVRFTFILLNGSAYLSCW